MKHDWRRIAWTTLGGTVFAIAFSFVLNYLLLFDDTLTPFGQMMLSAGLVPVAIGAPLSLLLAVKQQEVKRARRELTRSATFDGTTAFFNGSAFSALVDRRVFSPSSESPRSGAFLVIDVENFRSINMRFGLDWGDEALKLVASVIRASVRQEDAVGRLGASEFGIFLPGATAQNASEVGERIRAGVAANYFAPAGEKAVLAANVGGVVFEDDMAFGEMFRAAGQQLPDAEMSGTVAIVFNSNDQAAMPPAPATH